MLMGATATVAAAALTVTGVVLTRSSDPAPAPVADAAEAAAEPLPTGPPPPPVTTQSLDLDGKPVVEKGRETLRLAKRSVTRFSLLGVTWNDALLSFKGDAAVRTRSTASGDWSSWQSLDLEPAVAAGDPDVVAGRTRGGSLGLWVGESNGVEVKVVSAAGRTSNKLPAGLRLTLVDPGPTTSGGQGGGLPLADPEESASVEPPPADTDVPEPEQPPADTPEPAASTPSSPAATTAATPAPTTTKPPATTAPNVPANSAMPAYVSRKGWSADETLVKNAPVYGTTINALFVHHTAQSGSNSNGYACADAGKIIRSIYTYAVTGKKLNDMEYNFLVDKCGTLYEGRKGGVGRPVVGAHTPPFNTNYAAVAVLGEFSTTAVPAAVTTKIAQLAAYKLGLYGNDPAAKFTTTAQGSNDKVKTGDRVTMGRIAGHRDVQATACPGNALYARLPALRTEAAGVLSGLRITGLADGRQSSATYVVRDTLKVSWSVSTPGGVIGGFEVRVDGKRAATAAATARSASVKLAPGRHSVQIQLNRVDGPTSVSAVKTVTADITKPAFPGRPDVTLRTGAMSPTAAPVKLSWQASDAVGLSSVRATAPVPATFGPSVRSWNTSAKPGAKTTWRLQAVDLAGNAIAAPVTRTTTLVAETKGKRSGKWSKAAGGSHLGKAALASSAKNASLSWTFTARSVALLAMKSKTSGKMSVYVDGKKVGTVDLKSGTTAYRQAVWAKSWSSTKKHTVKIVVVGTKGRPKVTTDGIIHLK